MKRLRRLFFLLLATMCLQQVHAQQNKEPDENENKLHHRLSFILAHSHIPAANEVNGSKRTFIAATIGFNYDLWLNKKWAVGLHNDFTTQSFNIEKTDEGDIVAREYPVLASLVAIYKPVKHWIFLAGPGKEFEKNENFNVIKTGVEYGVDLKKHWEVAFGFEYDKKFGGYSSWLIGIGISKLFF